MVRGIMFDEDRLYELVNKCNERYTWYDYGWERLPNLEGFVLEKGGEHFPIVGVDEKFIQYDDDGSTEEIPVEFVVWDEELNLIDPDGETVQIKKREIGAPMPPADEHCGHCGKGKKVKEEEVTEKRFKVKYIAAGGKHVTVEVGAPSEDKVEGVLKDMEGEDNVREIESIELVEDVNEEEVVKAKGTKMYGDNTLYENMVNDFEAIEKDPNKNVEENVEEKKDEPKELKPKHSGEKMKKLEEDEEADSESESKGDEVKEETLHPAEEVKEEEVDEETNEQLTPHSDNILFIQPGSFSDGFDLLTTKEGSNQATVIFKFVSEEAADAAGSKVADAIGGTYVGPHDPRRDRKRKSEEPVESKEVREGYAADLDAETLTALKDAWELIGTYDDDAHVRSMASEKVEEVMEFIGDPEMDLVRQGRADELPREE
jgi:hypothetical protein